MFILIDLNEAIFVLTASLIHYLCNLEDFKNEAFKKQTARGIFQIKF